MLLQVEGLRKSFGRRVAVDDVTGRSPYASVEAGETA